MSNYNQYTDVHAAQAVAGPGDARPTAIQIVEANDLVGQWSDKVVLVTGCSSGIGVDTAHAMATTGAKVYAAVRNVEKGKKAMAHIIDAFPGQIEFLQLDNNSLDSVRACAKAFLSKESKLNVLINNAGIMMIPTRELTQDGFESQFGVNHLAHFLLFQLLKPALLAAATPDFHSRVVNLSSSGHRISSVLFDNLNFEQPDSYTPGKAYGNAKTANIYMANEIERRYGGGSGGQNKIHGHSLNPGGIETGLQVHSPHLQAMMKDPKIIRIMKSPAQGASTTVWAAVDKEWEGKGGKYLDDCQVALPAGDPDDKGTGGGYAPWTYDEEAEKKLWVKSCELVGVEDD